MKLKRTGELVVFAVVLCTTAAGFGRLTSASASHTVPITVTVTGVQGVGDDLDGIGRGDADFYAGVEFNGGSRTAGPSFATHVDDAPAITPFWPIAGSVLVVDDSSPAASVTLSIWDHDDCDAPFCADTGVFESDDDQLDIKPGDGETITLTVNLTNGRWSGTANWPTNCVTGDGGEAVKVCFDISVDSASGDADGDFLLDGWERNGYNADGDGTVDVNLPVMGADPRRRDLFLEVDCLADAVHSHCPLQGAMQQVVQSFADAPVANADGTSGIQLHVDIGGFYTQAAGTDTKVLRAGSPTGGVTGTFGNYGAGGEQIPEAGNQIVDWDGATGSPATNFFTLKGARFNAARDYTFRYALFVHQTNARGATNDCTSGWAKGIPGVNFLVSLGGTGANGTACWGTDATGNSVGTQAQQAGTMMHEFGHTLGLQHGGGDGLNNKPNYLSVMNYSFQSCGVTAAAPTLPGGCDYSRINLPVLNEVNPPGLDECAGIGGGLGLGGIDWSGVGGLTGATCPPPNTANVSANINGDFNDADNDGTQDPGEAPVFGPLPGFEDWNSIFYGFRTIPNFQSAGVPVDDEPDPETIEASRAALAQLVHPVLSVDKTGPSDAIPGDTLNYGIKAANTGRGPALGTVITDTKPDGSQQTFDVGTLTVGSEANRGLSMAVPCAAADGTVLTNGATATATDMLGNPVAGSDSVQTTIHSPMLTVSTTATPAVNAGDAITYRFTYENTGTGTATGVVVTDTVPAGVYYSQALDLGSGPRPDSVTLNADGTRTLVWNVGNLAGTSGPKTIEFTARPTLLALAADSFTNAVAVSFTNTNGCVYPGLHASATTAITVIPPTQDPHTLGYWRNHPADGTDEIRARIQATDQRYDTNSDGRLDAEEVATMYAPGGNEPKVLQMQLLSVYFNLATHRVNAGTGLNAKTAIALGLNDVKAAAVYAANTLTLPVNTGTRERYSNANTVLDDINNNKGVVY